MISQQLEKFKIIYDEQQTPCIHDLQRTSLVFLSADYSEVVLKIILAHQQLKFVPFQNISDFNLGITRLNSLEYQILPIEH